MDGYEACIYFVTAENYDSVMKSGDVIMKNSPVSLPKVTETPTHLETDWKEN